MNVAGVKAVATAVRTLSMDSVQRAGSGHPGQPMGFAEVGALVYGEILNHYPPDPSWANRDRFVLSAGHGCLLQYALLHLCGYGISLQDLKSFRRLNSMATGHPEHGTVPGIEVTTGPLGQGIANAVGMAIAERMLAARFNSARTIIDYSTYAVVGDGDLMEGVCYEASSLAGHLGLGNLIVFYDSNGVTIEGSIRLSFSDDVRARFQACNWHCRGCARRNPFDGREGERPADLPGRAARDHHPERIEHRRIGSVLAADRVRRLYHTRRVSQFRKRRSDLYREVGPLSPGAAGAPPGAAA
jgi:transketolase